MTHAFRSPRTFFALALAACALSSAPIAPAQGLVMDLLPSTTDPSSLPTRFVTDGKIAYFAAHVDDTPLDYRELWKTDGTSAGTVRIKRLPVGSHITSLGLLGSLLYLTVRGPTSEDDELAGLWKSDGTWRGTVRVAALRRPDSLTVDQAGRRLFLRGASAATGDELYTSDGTTSGTRLVTDLRPGSLGSLPLRLVAAAGGVFFTADDGTHGHELCFSGGTAATTRVFDIDIGSPSSRPDWLTRPRSGSGRIYFTAYTRALGRELYSATSTAARLEKDIRPGSESSSPDDLVPDVTQDCVYFAANDGIHGREVWTTSGSVHMVGDLRPGALGSVASWPYSDAFGTFFCASATGGGWELYQVGPSTIQRVVAFQNLSNGRAPRPLGRAPSGRLLYHVNVVDPGERLDSIDVFRRSVTPLTGLRALTGIWGAVLLNGALIFTGGHLDSDYELWRSDGTPSGTWEIEDLSPPVGRSSDPRELTSYGGKLYFSAYDGNGLRLWRSDGTTAGTTRVPDPPSGPLHVTRLVATSDIDGLLYARVASNALYHVPVNGAPTPVATNSFVGERFLVPFTNGDIMFSVGPGELWIAENGQSARLIKDLTAGGGPGVLDYQGVKLAGRQAIGREVAVYFAADDGQSGAELWRTDGTEQGTYLVADIEPGAASSITADPQLLRVGSVAYLVAERKDVGRELWVTNGMPGGTKLVKDIRPGALGCNPRELTAIGNWLYFVADDGQHGEELWRSDGTEAGTQLVQDVQPGASSSRPLGLTAAGASVFFSAWDETHGRELWVSPTKSVSASLARDVEPGVTGSMAAHAPAIAQLGSSDRALFAAAWGQQGLELWRSDATSTGTQLLANIAIPDPEGSMPADFLRIGRKVFFTAFTPAAGRELHVIDLATAGGVMVDVIGRASLASNGVTARIDTRGTYPTIGNSSFELRTLNAPANAPAVLLLSDRRADRTVGPGHCVVYPAFPLMLGIQTTTDGEGKAIVPLPIPVNPALRGAELVAQFAIVDAGGCLVGSLSLSHGLHLMLND